MKGMISFLFLIFSIIANGQVFPVDHLRKDFDTLTSALKEGHGGLFRFYSGSEIRKHFAAYRKKLKRPMSEFEFFGFLSKFLAEIGDGHMRVDYDEKAHAHLPRLQFPFSLLMEKDRTVILSNDTKDNTTIKPGMELIGINGRTMKDIRKTILSHLRSDGYNQTGKQARLERSFSAHYWSFFDRSIEFVVEARDSSGKKFKEKVNGIRNADREMNRNQNRVNTNILLVSKVLDGSPDNLALRIVNDSIGILRVRLFDGKRFTREIDSLFELVAKRNVKALILNLRGNIGGLDHLGAYLMSKFTTTPFRYLDRIHTPVLIPSYATWKQKPPVDLINGTVPDPQGGYLLKPMLNSTLSEQLPTIHTFTGKIVVLIDGNTFSAASDFSAILSNLTNAVFVGVETGGGYQGNSSGLNAILQLPYSKFNVNIHLWDYWSAVKPPEKPGRGVMPHYYVERKIDDWLKGIDTQLEAALKLCK